MTAARAEYASLTAGIDSAPRATSDGFEGSREPAYRLDGIRLNDQSSGQGVYIYNGKKVLLK